MSRDERGPRDPQSTLAELLRTYARPSLWFPRHPLVTWRMLLLLLRLPVVKHRPAARGHERALVARALPRGRFARLTVIQQARHVLTLPTDGTPYNEGRARATQRRKARSALKLGVTSRVITDRAERISLLEKSADFERVDPNETYRETDPDNRELLDVDLWMAAFHEDEPVMLVIIPVDGDFAALSYFRTLTHTDASSAARYLMTERLAEELVSRDVRYLCDHVNPLRLRPGLFHFAQMVGFRVVRVQRG